MNHPRILGIGTANPSVRLTQQQSFHAAGYQSERIRKIFLNSDIDYRHFYLEGAPNREESSDQLNQRYLRGAMKTGCQAILNSSETHRIFLTYAPTPGPHARIRVRGGASPNLQNIISGPSDFQKTPLHRDRG